MGLGGHKFCCLSFYIYNEKYVLYTFSVNSNILFLFLDPSKEGQILVIGEEPYLSPTFKRNLNSAPNFRHYRNFDKNETNEQLDNYGHERNNKLSLKKNNKQLNRKSRFLKPQQRQLYSLSKERKVKLKNIEIPDQIIKDGQVFYRYDGGLDQKTSNTSGRSQSDEYLNNISPTANVTTDHKLNLIEDNIHGKPNPELSTPINTLETVQVYNAAFDFIHGPNHTETYVDSSRVPHGNMNSTFINDTWNNYNSNKGVFVEGQQTYEHLNHESTKNFTTPSDTSYKYPIFTNFGLNSRASLHDSYQDNSFSMIEDNERKHFTGGYDNSHLYSDHFDSKDFDNTYNTFSETSETLNNYENQENLHSLDNDYIRNIPRIDTGGLFIGSGIAPQESEIEQVKTDQSFREKDSTVSGKKDGIVGLATYHHGQIGTPPGPGELLTAQNFIQNQLQNFDNFSHYDYDYGDYPLIPIIENGFYNYNNDSHYREDNFAPINGSLYSNFGAEETPGFMPVDIEFNEPGNYPTNTFESYLPFDDNSNQDILNKKYDISTSLTTNYSYPNLKLEPNELPLIKNYFDDGSPELHSKDSANNTAIKNSSEFISNKEPVRGNLPIPSTTTRGNFFPSETLDKENQLTIIEPESFPGSNELNIKLNSSGITGNTDVKVIVANKDDKKYTQRIGDPLQPGERIPGLPGFVIPAGFRGRVILGKNSPIEAESKKVVKGFNTLIKLQPQNYNSNNPVFSAVGGPGSTGGFSADHKPGIHVSLSSGALNVPPKSNQNTYTPKSNAQIRISNNQQVSGSQRPNGYFKTDKQQGQHKSHPETWQNKNPANNFRNNWNSRPVQIPKMSTWSNWNSHSWHSSYYNNQPSRSSSLQMSSSKMNVNSEPSKNQSGDCGYWEMKCFITYGPTSQNEVCKPVEVKMSCCC